jgi:SNF2 family DNA or RNA helicase
MPPPQSIPLALRYPSIPAPEERIRVSHVDTILNEELLLFCFHLGGNNDILLALEEIQLDGTVGTKPTLANIDMLKVHAAIRKEWDENVLYDIRLVLPRHRFHEKVVSEISPLRSLAQLARINKCDLITFEVVSIAQAGQNTVHSMQDDLMEEDTPMPDDEIEDTPMQDDEIEDTPRKQPRALISTNLPEVSPAKGTGLTDPLQEMDIVVAQPVPGNNQDSDFHPSIELFDDENNVIDDNRARVHSEALDFAEKQVKAREADGAQFTAEERDEAVREEADGALETLDPETGGTAIASANVLFKELNDTIQADLKAHVKSLGEETAVTGDSGEQFARNVSLLIDTQKRCEHQSPEDWAECCLFVGRELRLPDGTYNLSDFDWSPWFKRSFKAYQVLAIFKLFKFHVFNKGGLLGDEQGLGKTATSLGLIFYLAVFEWLSNHWLVKANQNNPLSHIQRLADGTYSAKRCPTARKFYIPFICPCDPQCPEWLRRHILKKWFPFGVQVVISQPNVLNTWVSEFSQMFEVTKGRRQLPIHFRLWVAHNELKWQPTGNISRLDGRSAASLRMGTDNTEALRMANIVLTTPRSYDPQFHAAMVEPVRNSKSPSQYKIASCYIDESQKFRGAESSFSTQVLGSKEQTESSLFLLSGTAWEKGPDDLRVYGHAFANKWEHFKNDAKWLPKEMIAARTVFTPKNLKALQSKIDSAYKTVQMSNPQHKKQIRELADELAFLFEQVMIRRTAKTIWLDRKDILDLPPLKEDIIICNPEAGTAVEKQLLEMGQAAALLFTNAIKLGEKNKLLAKRANTSNNVSKSVLNKLTSRRPLVTFPGIASLANGLPHPETGEIEKIETFNADALQEDYKIFSQLGNNILTRHIDAIIKDSPKFNSLINEIKAALGRTECIYDTITKKTTKKGPRIPKIVIFSSKPVTAAITYEAICYTIRRDGIVKADGTVPSVQGYFQKTSRKVRDEIVDNFQEVPKLDKDGNMIKGKLRFEDPVDILVGTIETLGVGITLHRGSLVVLMEPQFLVTEQDQAKKRIHRMGQKYGCRALILHTNIVQSECLIADRASFRKALAGAVTTATREVRKEAEEREEEDAV